jgi:hypothetical protein
LALLIGFGNFPVTVSRRNYTPSPPLPKPDQHGQRRNTGGARREASERIALRADNKQIDGWTLNVSRGGVRVIVEEPVELGREYELVIGDDTRRPRRKGRVVWVQDEADGQIAGVQYLDVDHAVVPAPSAPDAASDDEGGKKT